MTTIDLNLHPFQQAVYDTKAPNAVIEAARRGGKSRVALRKLQKVIQEKMPQSVSEHVTPPFHAWIVAPNFPQSNQVWTELLTFIPREWMMGEPSIEHKTIRLNGAVGGRAWGLIEVKSAHEATSLQTAGLDFLWVTEAQEISNDVFVVGVNPRLDFFLTKIRQRIGNTLLAFKHCLETRTSTQRHVRCPAHRVVAVSCQVRLPRLNDTRVVCFHESDAAGGVDARSFA